jgi:hypothetical protein
MLECVREKEEEEGKGERGRACGGESVCEGRPAPLSPALWRPTAAAHREIP